LAINGGHRFALPSSGLFPKRTGFQEMKVKKNNYYPGLFRPFCSVARIFAMDLIQT